MNVRSGDRLRLGAAGLSVLFTEEQIGQRVREIGASLRTRLGERNPIFIGLLSGSFVFLADLIRAFGAPHEVDFLKVSRYDDAEKGPAAVRVMHDLRSNVQGRHVVLVEGIRARGTKIQYVDRFLRLHQPASVEYCAMIRPKRAPLEVPLNETGFLIDNEYVVGYGLDLGERHRNLPFIGALERGLPEATIPKDEVWDA